MTQSQKDTITKEGKFLYTCRQTFKAFGTEAVSGVKLFDEYYDFFNEPLNLEEFVAYIEEELVGIYVIEKLQDGLNYRITKLTF
tara:strand:+ start:222 stop:473 length:252 start_codon:yes stop_codon:yes gene_type:complete